MESPPPPSPGPGPVLLLAVPFLPYPDQLRLLSVSAFFRASPSLRSHLSILTLSNLPEFPARLASAIMASSFGKAHLRSLNFQFSKISDSLLQRTPPRIESLNLNGCRQITDEGLVCVAQRLATGGAHLRELQLYWNVRITDIGVRKLVRPALCLEILNLSGCSQITDFTVSLLPDSCPHLKTLNLTRCRKLTDQAMHCVAKLSHLEKLYLYAVEGISDAGFALLGANPDIRLRELDITGNQNIATTGFRALSKTLGSLEFLSLAWCQGVRDEALVEYLQTQRPKLRLLCLYGLLGVTDATLDALEGTPSRESLRVLDVNGCVGVERKSKEQLKKRFEGVERVEWHS